MLHLKKTIILNISLIKIIILNLGVIALWDFETGKLEGILKADEVEVT